MGIFLTGGTGYVGRAVLRRLLRIGSGPVYCLSRDPSRLPEAEGGVHSVPGDLHGAAAYASALAECDTVVHLAASTGRATAAEHFRVNAEGTRILLDHSRRAGIRRFLHVSTIAVTYPEKRYYPYARSKEEAEEGVRESGLDWAVLRPTIVLGAGSPLAETFRRLAGAPVLPLPGSGRVRVQPVHVEDVAACVVALLGQERFGGRTFELGGRDVLTVEEFLRTLRRELIGREGPVLRVPLGLLLWKLAVAERILPFLPPVTAGQLYAFRHDGVATPDPELRPSVRERQGVAEMAREIRGGSAPARAACASRKATLDAECLAFCLFLTDEPPSGYVRDKYRRAHEPGRQGPERTEEDANDFLVRFARRGRLATRLADTWSAVFDRGGVLRRKLVLLLAILESTGETSGRIDTPDRGSRGGFLVRTAATVVLFVCTLLLAGIVLLPGLLFARNPAPR